MSIFHLISTANIRYFFTNAQLFDQRVDIVLQFLLSTPEFVQYLETHCNDPDLAHPPPVMQLEGGPENIVNGFITPTQDQEEASYEGTLKVMINLLHDLHLNTADEQKKTGLSQFIVWLGDQLTTDHLHTLWHLRAEDHNSFDHFDWMLPLFGWFHLIMAFANSLHKQYLGTSATIGSLHYAFDILKRKDLLSTATKGPFWHHLDEAIHHIAEAHFLASWLAVAEVGKITDLTECTPHILCKLAIRLIEEHSSQKAFHNLDKLPKAKQDPVKQQWIMWNVDVLPYLDLRAAVKKGDVGRMENLLPILLFHFAGGGNSNYMGKILNLLQGLQQEWPEDVRMHGRKWCWVFTCTGKPDSAHLLTYGK
ncbi:hypothetical protein EV368DRAFT_90182 [Lentinula lateritia]|nr:hypothetical protein EV368DRAFT_90182 [Lentinula lateritia]